MTEKPTILDTYRATANEMQLIEALSDPENRDLNVTELCKAVGIARQTYYDMFKKPDFVKFYNNFQLELVKSSIGDIIAATVHFAKTEPKAHQDRKMLLEMGSMYKERQEIEIKQPAVRFANDDQLVD